MKPVAAPKLGWKHFAVDKTEMRSLVAIANAEIGIIPDPSATPQIARALMIEDGVHPEDNIFSCGIIAARDEY